MMVKTNLFELPNTSPVLLQLGCLGSDVLVHALGQPVEVLHGVGAVAGRLVVALV